MGRGNPGKVSGLSAANLAAPDTIYTSVMNENASWTGSM
jgi:hypothetical protein